MRLAGREILHDVTFSVAAGEVTGLIGMNGAGKTTLLRALLGLLPVSGGKVTLAQGRPGRQSTGYVPQKVVLDADLPVRARDLVELGMDGRRLGVPLRSGSKRAAVERLLASVDALHLADARVGALSAVSSKRSSSLMPSPATPCCCCSTSPWPTSTFPSTQETVSLLGRIAREQDVAVLLSTHDINPLLPVMDRVVYLAGGRAASGRTDEVVRSDVLSALYGRHVDVFHAHGRVLVSVGDEHREEGCEVVSEDEPVMGELGEHSAVRRSCSQP